MVDVKDMKDFIKCPGNQFLDTNGTCRCKKFFLVCTDKIRMK